MESEKGVPKDAIMRPGPVLKRAMKGDFKKGKHPKGVMSASAVADACAKAWGK